LNLLYLIADKYSSPFLSGLGEEVYNGLKYVGLVVLIEEILIFHPIRVGQERQPEASFPFQSQGLKACEFVPKPL